MSQPEQPKKAGATFTWVLGAFAGFAVLFILIQAVSDSKQGFDPREQERRDNTAEILKAQSEAITKLGLNGDGKKKVFENSLVALAAKKPGVSSQVVPGSPTQLKQAAASVPAPAAPAPAASAPAPAAPAPAPAAPASPK